jgi:hypothetical protein
MAISATHFSILKELKSRGILPQGGRILEIGEANWYGDFSPEEVFADAGESCDPKDAFAVAKLIYKATFAPILIDAIDLDPSRLNARKEDLNQQLYGGPICCAMWDVVYNHGTAEHVFNIAQVFKSMHDQCTIDGLLIHESPFTGWVDHGFYCLQPTLFWDVASANNYKMEFVGVEHLASRTWFEVECREQLLEMKCRDQLPDNAMLFVVMRKQVAEPFKIPMQGVYSGEVNNEVREAWMGLR